MQTTSPRRYLLSSSRRTDPKPDQTRPSNSAVETLTGQLKPLSDSIESLVKQRIQLGAQIQQMEAQVQELKQSALVDLQPTGEAARRRTGGRETTNSSKMAKQSAEAMQKPKEEAKQPAQAAALPCHPAANSPALPPTPALPRCGQHLLRLPPLLRSGFRKSPMTQKCPALSLLLA